jgi:hypothetical protein
MKTSDKGLKLIHSNSGRDADQLSRLRLRIIAVAVGLIVLLAGAGRWSPFDAGPQQQAGVQPKAETQAEPASIDYFPAQFLNQATEVEEHIQAF